MSRFVAFLVVCAALAVGLSARAAAAQATVGRVALSVTVLPQATIERVTPPTVARRAGDTTEYRVMVAVRANTSYRVVARRTGSTGPKITLGVNARTALMGVDRAAVQLARGDLGVTTFEITYAVDDDTGTEPAAGCLRFEVLADPVVPGER